MPNKKVSNDVRLALIRMIESNMSVPQAAIVLQIEYRTASRIWKKYQLEGEANAEKRGGYKAKKLTDEMIEGIR